MAVSFSATGQHYSSTSGVPTTRLFTVAVWAYALSAGTGVADILWSIEGTSDATSLIMSEGTLIFDWPGGGPSQLNGAAISSDTWYKTAVSVNGNAARLYQGAAGSALVQYTTGSNYALPAGTLKLGIGSFASLFAGAGWLNGRLACYKMWDAELTQAEIERELNYYLPGRTANVNRWHPFVNGEATDYSGNGRTLSGGVGAVTGAGPPISWTASKQLILPWDPTTTVWYAHYDTTSGYLLSLGTVAPSPVPSGTALLELLGPPNQATHEWSPVARTFVPRVGEDIRDRVDDLIVDASLASVWSTLDSTQDAALRSRIGQMLGPHRSRLEFQPPDLE
jgi:hypothetical protein